MTPSGRRRQIAMLQGIDHAYYGPQVGCHRPAHHAAAMKAGPPLRSQSTKTPSRSPM